MRKIAVITVGRSDYSIYKPLIDKITQDPELELFLIASGSHLSHEFGMTIHQIEADGFQ